MFQDCVLTYYAERCHNIDTHFLLAFQYYDPDGLHDLRVEIKQLRSCFRLIEWITPEFTAKAYLRTIRKLFKSAADLRDIHVQQELTRAWSQELGVFLSEYYNRLKQHEFPARDRFASFAAQCHLQQELEQNHQRILQALVTIPDDEAIAKTRERIEHLLQRIIQHGSEDRLQESDLHKLRILSKETRYTLHIVQACLPESICYSDELDQQLRSLHQVLGKWHDTEIALRHLDEFQTAFQQELTESDRKPLTGIGVYSQVAHTLQKKKIDLLDEFEIRWNDFIRFLKGS